MPDYAVLSGVVDGKNDRGQRVQILFCALGDSKKLAWVKTAGVSDEVPVPEGWRERAALIDSLQRDDQSLASYGALQVRLFIQDNQAVQRAILQGNVKPLEYDLVRFAMDRLALKAVTVARMDEISEDEARSEFEAVERRSQAEAQEEALSGGEGAPYKPQVPHLVMLTCQPVLDPVGGIPLQALSEGDEILAALPQDSFFFDIFKSKIPDFDGVVSARVMSVKKTETGSTQVDLFLSEGLVGVLRLSGNVRVKRSVAEVQEKEPIGAAPPPSPMVMIGVGVALALAAGVAFYLFFR
ncbi:hypothetical protein Taci_0352 [Thermanaerovibrio acidaminovorans DSM 6589]|uniref:Uncharacterized protein n=1 Tax=Thermanaerovibrio acidaminovorans (strain ATCC 49978 / DSM 6589 / Su883) TaxID=525903 RepID=D1B8I6_THEAS|nr:hypothetical protein [Thermanaerovibrio acidaminovorans]ACZ18589.1 hypothetical protein Taci_0352 [Thermanaerovibrio acidaminovorans DSM 6589]